MKKTKEFFIRNRKRFIVAISLVLILIALINIYFVVEVRVTSNDECLWIPKKIQKDSVFIFFDHVKVGGVTWEAGIRDRYQLIAINDSVLENTFAAQRILNQVEEGQYAKYTVKRNDKIFTTDVRIKKLFLFPSLA